MTMKGKVRGRSRNLVLTPGQRGELLAAKHVGKPGKPGETGDRPRFLRKVSRQIPPH